MQKPAHVSPQAGIALIAVLLMLSLLMALAAALAFSVNMDTSLRGALSRVTAGFYAAESGLNGGMGTFRNIFLSGNVPTAADFVLKTMVVGGRTVDYQMADVTPYLPGGVAPTITIPPGFLFGGLKATQYQYIANSTAEMNGNTEADLDAQFNVGNIPIFQFIAFFTRDLEVAPGANMTLNGRVHTNGDLYLDADNATLTIGDSPPTVSTVQVTAQGEIYRGRKRSSICEPGTVTVDMLQDTVAPAGDLDPKNLNCSGSATRLVPSSEIATWKGSMLNRVQSISVPQPGLLARGNGNKYWDDADLRIVLNLNAGWTPTAPLVGPAQFAIEVQDKNGGQDTASTAILQNFMKDTAWNTANSTIKGTRPVFYTDVPITSGAPNNCNCTNSNATNCTNMVAACYNPGFAGATAGSVPTAAQNNRVYATGTTMTGNPAGANGNDADYRRGGFYNWREGKWMYLLNLNVQDLLAWNQAKYTADPTTALFNPADRSNGGIVLYLSVQGVYSNSAANNYGVRIFGSGTLPFPNMGADPTGITIVSDQAIYLAGNYNSVGTKQPASFMGDSINVLSSSYFSTANPPAAGSRVNDAQSNTSVTGSSRVAGNTTINAGFLGGVDDTTAGGGSAGYNGGLENYPRFHEDWTGKTLTYRGSFVSLGVPLHVQGKWCGTGGGCNIYSPPTRNWNYEPDFGDVAKLPPDTPNFVYVQQVSFTEMFK